VLTQKNIEELREISQITSLDLGITQLTAYTFRKLDGIDLRATEAKFLEASSQLIKLQD